MTMPKNPIQPLIHGHGVLRFKKNAIVDYLLDFAQRRGVSLNEIANLDVSQDDRQQFAQLIGYSLNGYGELPYHDAAVLETACTAYNSDVNEKDARIIYLEAELAALKDGLRAPMARLFNKHPDDLE